MLNTLASYLWGSAPEAEQGYTEAQSPASEGEHLNTQHDGDWVVVDAGNGSATHENAQRLTEGEVQERVEDPVHTDSTAVQRQQTPRSRALHSIGVHNVITPEQMVKQVRSARRVQRQKHQRSINKQKCERQNKVEHLSQYNKGKNKQNKCAHPSGFKASRNTQRM